MLLPTDFGLGPKAGTDVGGCGEGRTGQTRLPACCFLQGPRERGGMGAGSCSTAVVPGVPAAKPGSHCTVLLLILGSAAVLISSITKPPGGGQALLLSESKTVGTKSPATEPGPVHLSF